MISRDIDNKCIIIDPGLNEAEIDQKILELKLEPVAILSTHGHFDHISSAYYYKKKYGIPHYMHAADMKLLKSAIFFLKLSKIAKSIKTSEPEVLIKEVYRKFCISGFYFEFYNFPGHTDGSCLIQYENNIFTGDTIFKKGLFINSLPGENVEKLKSSIIEIYKRFDLNLICFPGHGSDATLNQIKLTNFDLINFINN